MSVMGQYNTKWPISLLYGENDINVAREIETTENFKCVVVVFDIWKYQFV